MGLKKTMRGTISLHRKMPNGTAAFHIAGGVFNLAER